jgi:type II secretory pathway component PulF
MAKISQSQMAKLFRRLATAYSAGIDIRSAFMRETESGTTTYREKTKQISDGLNSGLPLADSLELTDGYFPDLALSVVKAGERGGRLEESFKRLSKHYENLVAFRNKFLSAIAWPAFELLFAIFIVGGLMVICDWIFESLEREKFNWLLMGSTTGNVIAYFFLVGLLLVGFGLLVHGTAQGWFGSVPIRIAMKIPLIGKTIECLALSRFAWTMSVAENAGMNPVETAELSLNSTENFYYKELIPRVCRKLQGGASFYSTFKETEQFPTDLLIYIDNGETAGELAESMNRASNELQTRAELNLKAIGTIGFAMMILFVAGLVLLIAVFAMSQYLGFLNDLSKPGAFR